MRQKKGFPIWGKLSAKRTDEGKAYVAAIKTGNKANFPLIRRCGATFSLRAKSRLRRLRSDQPPPGAAYEGCGRSPLGGRLGSYSFRFLASSSKLRSFVKKRL